LCNGGAIRADLTSLSASALPKNPDVRLSSLLLVSATLCASSSWAQETDAVARAGAPSSSTSQGTGVISGHVTSADGQPLARADVFLETPDGTRRIVANAGGWFEFANLAPGQYHVSATQAGYLTRFYGQTLDQDRPARIRLKNGQVRSDVDLILPKSSVVTVQLTDELNAPVEGAQVHVRQVIWVNGQPQYAPGSSKQRTATTNDRGEIRVVDLPPGEYYVSATLTRVSSRGSRVSTPPTFYPGVSSFTDAQPVTLALSEELTVGLSVVRPAKAEPALRLGVIAVHVTDESGNPREGVEVRALAMTGEGETRTMNASRHKTFYTNDNGDARIYGLPGGQYVVVAQPQLSHVIGDDRNDRGLVFPPTYYPGSPAAGDAQAVSIAEWDEVNLDLRLAPVPAARISGRVVRPDGEPSQSTIVLRSNPAGPLYSERATTASLSIELVDGTFVFHPLQPGDYIIETDDRHLARREGRVTLPITVAQGDDINDLVLTVVPRRSSR
jgi:hypothetical protein